MTAETRLRDATRAYTERIDVAPDGWKQLCERLEPRRRRPWLVAATGSALVLVVVFALSMMAGPGHDPPESTNVGRFPASIVALTTDGRVVVVSSRDGQVIRTLAVDAQPQGGLAVSPDGRTVYYAQLESSTCGTAQHTVVLTQIVSVPVTGGAAQVIATNVQYPAVSPDGRHLAFTGIPGCSDAGDAVLVLDLGSGSAGSRPYDRRLDGHAPPQAPGGEIVDLSWAADSRHLAFEWHDATKQRGYVQVVDTATTGSIPDGSFVPFAADIGWFGYRGATGDFLGLLPVPGPSSPATVATFDAETGALRAKLFDVPGTNRPEPETVGSLRSDRSGRHLLVSMQSAAAELLRWNDRERSPKSIAVGIRDAVWLSKRSS